MFQKILVPVDLADPEFVKPALATAVELATASGGLVRLINVIPMTPVMLANTCRRISTCSSAVRPRRRSTSSRRKAGSTPRSLDRGASGRHLSRGVGGGESVRLRRHRDEFAPAAMKTYFLGSNAGHMVRYAKCSCWWYASRPHRRRVEPLPVPHRSGRRPAGCGGRMHRPARERMPETPRRTRRRPRSLLQCANHEPRERERRAHKHNDTKPVQDDGRSGLKQR